MGGGEEARSLTGIGCLNLSQRDLYIAGIFIIFLGLNLEMNFLLKWAMETLPTPTFQAAMDSVLLLFAHDLTPPPMLHGDGA